MQDGGDPAVDSGEAAIDSRGEVIRLADEFSVRAERAADIGEVSLLALPTRAQLRLKGIGLGGDALRINPLHRRLDRLPAAIVEHHSQDRNLILLGDGEYRVRRGKMKAAVTDDLYDASLRLRELQAQRHAAAEAEPAAGEADIASRPRAADMLLDQRRIAYRFVDDDIVLRQRAVQGREQIWRADRPWRALGLGGSRAPPFRRLAGIAPAGDPVDDAFAIAVVRARRDRLEHLPQHRRAIALNPDVGRKSPHREIRLQR